MTETVVLQIPEALYQRLAIASEAKLRSPTFASVVKWQKTIPQNKMLSINLDRETESYLAEIISQENRPPKNSSKS